MRRQKLGDEICCVNFKDDLIYFYKIVSMARSRVVLELVGSKKNDKKASAKISLAWAFTQNKTIEKALPFLNECFVDKLFLLPTHRSSPLRLNHERMREILINSSCQCGRADLMKIEVFDNLKDFAQKNDFAYLDFGGEQINQSHFEQTILVGPEGGFCEQDYEFFSKAQKLALPCDLVMQSSTAICALAARAMFV